MPEPNVVDPQKNVAPLTDEEKARGLTLEQKRAGQRSDQPLTDQEKRAAGDLSGYSERQSYTAEQGHAAASSNLPLTDEEKARGLTLEQKRLGAEREAQANVGASNLPLTEEEKARGVTLEQKHAGQPAELSDYDKAYFAHSGKYPVVDPATTTSRHEEALRQEHLRVNPNHRVQVDNNPVKVHVFVNKTGHQVPPGPIAVGELKRLFNLTGVENFQMNGRHFGDDSEEVELRGGERFSSEGNSAY